MGITAANALLRDEIAKTRYCSASLPENPSS